jgi:hypothetical protein
VLCTLRGPLGGCLDEGKQQKSAFFTGLPYGGRTFLFPVEICMTKYIYAHGYEERS